MTKWVQIRRLLGRLGVGLLASSMTATMREQDPIPIMPASRLGEYIVIQEIAEGTFGKVKSLYFFSSLYRSYTYPNAIR
jgi:hypothetical protein